MFQDALIFQNAIALCYNMKSMALQNRVPSPQTQVVYEVIVKILSPIVYGCVLNQSCVHSSCLQMFYNLSYQLVETFDKSWPLGLFLIALLKKMCLTVS